MLMQMVCTANQREECCTWKNPHLSWSEIVAGASPMGRKLGKTRAPTWPQKSSTTVVSGGVNLPRLVGSGFSGDRKMTTYIGAGLTMLLPYSENATKSKSRRLE